MEVAAFWLAVAAVIIAAGWYKSRMEAQKHQTFRTIIEKTGTVDEAQLRLLIPPPGPNPFQSVPGSGYRALRVGGAILMFVGGAGLFLGMLLGGILLSTRVPGTTDGNDGPGIFMGLGIAALMLGAGLFFASRFAEKPRIESERPGAGPARE